MLEHDLPVPDLPEPVAELHLHLEGTLEPETIFALAARGGIPLPYRDVDDLRARYEFDDLSSFLDLYYANMGVLRTRDDFETMTWHYARRAFRAGVRHAEVFVDPQAHTSRGVSCATVLHGVWSGLRRAEQELGISSGIIVCIVRDRPVAEARSILEECLATEVPLLGLGLDSAEVGYPPRLFAEVFHVAAEEQLHRVAHAGEEGPPEYVWEALDVLGVERVDHGVRCLEDEALVRRLVADQVPLTVCPLSNVRLKVIEQLSDHPLRRMLDRGLLATVNSDDPAYFGGYLDDNLRSVRRALGLSAGEMDILAENSITASFAPAERKAELLRPGEDGHAMTEDRRGVAVVTGGGTGVGAAVAYALAREGWAVVIAGRRPAPLEALAAAHPTLGLDPVPTDVTDESSVRRLFAGTADRYGRVDLLVNNAGRGAAAREIDEVDLEEWRAVVEVNLTGTLLCTREAFRLMRRQRPGGGRIINNGSISAHAPRPHSIAYTATKHAITGMTKSTALDGRRFDIACGQIDIGNASTDLTRAMREGIEQADGTIRSEPMIDVAEVGAAVVYMVSLPLTSNVATMTVMATKMPYVGRG